MSLDITGRIAAIHVKDRIGNGPRRGQPAGISLIFQFRPEDARRIEQFQLVSQMDPLLALGFAGFIGRLGHVPVCQGID